MLDTNNTKSMEGQERLPSDLLALQPSGSDGDNVLHARVGRWQAYVRWRPRAEQRTPAVIETTPVRPKRRLTAVLALSVIFFAAGAVVALGMAWELVSYIETTRVVGELARLKLGGALCFAVGLLLYLVRRSFRQ